MGILSLCGCGRVQQYPCKCLTVTQLWASVLIYLFKEGIEEGKRAVKFQHINQCKGPFPLETEVIPSDL